MEDTIQVKLAIRTFLSWKNINGLVDIFLNYCNVQYLGYIKGLE